MKISHTITIHECEADAFRAVGMELRSPGRLVKAVTFQIDEADPRWERVARIAKQLEVVDIPTTTFTRAELNGAQYLVMMPSWHHGYPQPEDDFGYLKATYDLKDYCKACGVGGHQIAPFRLKKPPVWGKRSIFQLNWVFDEYFVKPDIWETVFRPSGIHCRPVVLKNTGSEIDSVVQLDIPDLVDLEMGQHPYKECGSCRRKKLDPRVVGFFPAPQTTTRSNMFKSTQYFGSGARAYRQVLASNALYRNIEAAKVTGADFQPCMERYPGLNPANRA